MRVLGLDISSSTVGYSVIEYDGDDKPKLLICSSFNPPKKGSIIERLKETQNRITEILDTYRPDEVAIEEITQFMMGKSTAKTIIMLAVFNRSVGLACYDFTHKPPAMYSVMKIRHGLKTDKRLPDKTEIPELVAKHLDIKFPYVYRGKGDKKKIAKCSYDAADSLAVAYYHYTQLTNES
jgi:crossover junction endodeoxyribonuclease RuvC